MIKIFKIKYNKITFQCFDPEAEWLNVDLTSKTPFGTLVEPWPSSQHINWFEVWLGLASQNIGSSLARHTQERQGLRAAGSFDFQHILKLLIHINDWLSVKTS